ncbi:MAG TPA: AAA-like domain-containing protein [Armatimonadota bacterium]|nr:AAA-like domain-containing protein [Armatimonadota bacterium]
MLSPSSPSDHPEMAHVLLMDIVAYSQLTMRRQSDCIHALQDMVRATAAFQSAQAGGDLIILPTGDGMALVFFRHPLAPVECALEIARMVQESGAFHLRMGIHTGPVRRVEDLNAQQNVSGGGINLAQRVMNCGDPGHILLSRGVADLLRQLGEWEPYLHELGETEVKHGERITLFNLVRNEVGNPDVPEKLGRPAHSTPVVIPEYTAARLPAEAITPAEAMKLAEAAKPAEFVSPAKPRQVAILYKRRAQPDETILAYLEEGLSQRGYCVFVDRHLSVGVEWAREIERQVRDSYAVIPLLSSQSIYSEMLENEIQMAQRSAQEQAGRPQLLPVRIQYEGPLPPALAPILDTIQYILWQDPEDNPRLLEALALALEAKSPRPVIEAEKLEAIGGAVPLESGFYIERSTDQELRRAIARQDSIVLVKGARQVGKTSLMARGLQQSREAGVQAVSTDFQTLDANQLQSSREVYAALADSLADQLELDELLEANWDEKRGANANFERYLRREVLGKLDRPLVWAMDEVDRLFHCPFASEVFGLFRSWHNQRALNPSGPWKQLTMVIAYATEANLFITDMNQSPFNVGTRLTLEDFTLKEVEELNDRYGGPLSHPEETRRFYEMLGGQPYLTRRGLNELVNRGMTIHAFEAEASREDGPFGDHLRRILMLLASNDSLCSAVKDVLQGQRCPDAAVFYRLRTAGVLSGDSAREACPRSRLYQVYLSGHLL